MLAARSCPSWPVRPGRGQGPDIVTKGQPTTAASRMLEVSTSPRWQPRPEAARGADAHPGQWNLDEVRQGLDRSTPRRPPATVALTTHPAVLVAASGRGASGVQAPLALGTETAGSTASPLAVRTVGVKPTYGSASRYGVIAMASSLDQAGLSHALAMLPCCTRSWAATIPRTPPPSPHPVGGYAQAARAGAADGGLKGLRVGVVKKLTGSGLQAGVRAAPEESLEPLRAAGADIVEVRPPTSSTAPGAYYLIHASGAPPTWPSTTASGFGSRVTPEGTPTIEKVMGASRAAGFGDEVKRRIIRAPTPVRRVLRR
ncbi:amidase family protein [Kocuria rhizophila]|nr:amidase family protein [Kocuria rhizophila]